MPLNTTLQGQFKNRWLEYEIKSNILSLIYPKEIIFLYFCIKLDINSHVHSLPETYVNWNISDTSFYKFCIIYIV